jgi:hypothetical protein
VRRARMAQQVTRARRLHASPIEIAAHQVPESVLLEGAAESIVSLTLLWWLLELHFER